MDISCPVVFHMGQPPMHPFGRLGYVEWQVPQTCRDGTLLKAVQPETCLVLLRNEACFQKNDIKLFTSSLGYISCRG